MPSTSARELQVIMADHRDRATWGVQFGSGGRFTNGPNMGFTWKTLVMARLNRQSLSRG